MKIIRILHVVGDMNQGGTQNLLMNVYKSIDRDKIQFDFLVNRKGILDDDIKKLGGIIYYIPALQKVGQTSYIKNLDNFFNEHKEYKIIHSHINQVSGLILERAKRAQIPIRIAHSHNNKYKKNYFVRMYKMYLGRKLKANANYKFACSKEAGKFLFGKKSKFEIINNSIEVSKFTYNEEIRNIVRKDLQIDEGCYVIGNVGRLSYQKNPLFLLKIFKEFNLLKQNTKLLLIGKGNLKEKILRYIKKNKLENKVIMLEDRNDVNELMQAMDFFVLPSRFEGLGIVLIEAQASGMRCITSKGVAPAAKVTDLLEFYSLKNKPKEWSKKIYENMYYERKNTVKEIKNKNYDIIETAKSMQDIYIKLYNES